MKKTLIIASALGLALCQSAYAAPSASQSDLTPPQLSQKNLTNKNSQGRQATGYERMQEKAKTYAEPNPNLAPTSEDYAKARKDRAAGKYTKPESSRTEIETVRDQNNRVTEYVVTPGSTHIPYSVENKADRPSPVDAGQRKGTLGTPKFINFGF